MSKIGSNSNSKCTTPASWHPHLSCAACGAPDAPHGMHPPGPATMVWLWHSPRHRKRVELQPGSGAEAEQAARADAARMAAQVQETVAAVRRLEGHLDPSSELARLGRRYRAAAEAHGAAHAAWSVVASEGAAQHRGTDGGSPSPSSSQASHAWRIGWRTWTRHAGQDTSSRF